MEEKDYIHSTQLPAHFCCSCCNDSKAAAIAAAAMTARLLPLQLFSLSLYSLHTLTLSLTLSLCSHKHASFIGKHGELLQHMEGTIKP
jgi:hypothetical protein